MPNLKKVASNCKGLPQPSCKESCRWASGTKRSFCTPKEKGVAAKLAAARAQLFGDIQSGPGGCKGLPQPKCKESCRWVSGTKRSFCTTKSKRRSPPAAAKLKAARNYFFREQYKLLAPDARAIFLTDERLRLQPGYDKFKLNTSKKNKKNKY